MGKDILDKMEQDRIDFFKSILRALRSNEIYTPEEKEQLIKLLMKIIGNNA